jgi:hypothetical protein
MTMIRAARGARTCRRWCRGGQPKVAVPIASQSRTVLPNRIPPRVASAPCAITQHPGLR